MTTPLLLIDRECYWYPVYKAVPVMFRTLMPIGILFRIYMLSIVGNSISISML